MATLTASRVVTPFGLVEPGAVEVADGLIVDVVPTRGPVPSRTLVPGFVDLQVNGHGDVDVAHATGSDWDRLDEHLIAQGVTTWCPTLVSAPLDAYAAMFDRIDAARPRPGPRPAMAGIHLEGPFLGAIPGAHPSGLIQPIDEAWLGGLPPSVRIVTIGAEQRDAIRATEILTKHDIVVAIGHSAASWEEATAMADAGARMVTHCFNAMPPLHHREPGVVGASLADARLTVSLIADLIHVHPVVLVIAFRAKGSGRVALVTDAVAWRAAHVGEIPLHFDGTAPRLADGTLAGSALTMDLAVRNVVNHAGVPLIDAIAAAATTPAAVIGLEDRGRITPGARADVVALDGELRVERVWIGGECVR